MMRPICLLKADTIQANPSTDTTLQSESQPVRAAFWMIGTIVAFSAMAVAGRELSGNLDTFELMFYRSVIGLVIVLVVARMAGTTGHITTALLHIHLIRNISHFAGQNLWFFAVATIPLTQVFALEFTSPIWAMFLAVLVLRERLTKMRLFGAFLGFIGILIITRPWNITPGPGTIAAAAAAIGFAGSIIFTRLLTRSQPITSILFWLTAMQAVFGLLTTLWDGRITAPTTGDLPWLMIVSIGGLGAHFCLTKAVSLAPAAVVAPVDFARLPVIAVIGLLLYSESLDVYVLVGAIVVFGANYLNIVHETRKTATL